MKVKQLFERDIFRSINGVVKADQLDESSVWQELDEFVITQELDKHLRKFFASYLEAIDRPNDPDVAGNIGVWVSGFFGSGKSHFIKVLSYLLENKPHSHNGQSKEAVEFFEPKIQDAMLFGDIKRAVASNTDVILFNIDSKADTKAGRDAILTVFLKVLNDMQGFCPDHPHIAHMERYLKSKGKLQTFEDAFREFSGSDWKDERDAYQFHHDQTVDAFSAATGQSKDAAEKWIDGAEEKFSLTVENFCRWVKEYLDSQGSDHRVIFLVDEVGQFIGGDTHLMLNLQTIAEDLGTMCQGRAWIVVTSQEDIDAVLGEMRTTKSHDFSKIQGRFKTRLSLSSANVDEVIQERLLAKEKANGSIEQLEGLFSDKGDILRHQLTFHNVGMTFKNFRDADDFVRNYPFAPYQFQLVQRIFEAIRKAGATGLHLSRGERSILDAFQSAGQVVADCDVGVLVPLYHFYPSIESFLDTAVKRTIDQAAENPGLQSFDIPILQVLFLIRYVDEIKGNVDNLVTLCLNEIDADRLALRKQIEETLQRLEKETLISRSGDVYFFLTNEERDINREIKLVELSGHEEADLLGEIIFGDVVKGQPKHRFTENKMDFAYNRLCDGFPVGRRAEGGLAVSIITPLADDYELYRDERCVLESSSDGGQVLIRLDDTPALGREIRTYLKTDKYVRNKDDGTLPATTKRIHRDLADDNRERRVRLANLLSDMFREAGYFVAGNRLDVKGAAPSTCLDEALEYLIQNTFTKMGYIKKLSDNPLKELQAILRSNDIGQQALALTLEEGNPKAIAEVRSYIELATKASRPIVLYDTVERFAQRPYGWPADEVLILVARLLVLQEIQLVMDAAPLPQDRVYENITKSAKQRKITIVRRKTTDPRAIQSARGLGKQVFAEMGPDGEDALFTFLTKKLQSWEKNLGEYKLLAATGGYPGKDEIADGVSLCKALLACDDSYAFLERFNDRKDDLLDFSDIYAEIEHFYEHQRPTWETLRRESSRFGLNRMELERDDTAGPALQRIQEILAAPSPYRLIKEADGLIATVEGVNTKLVTDRRAEALKALDTLSAQVEQEVATAQGDASLKSTCLSRFRSLREQIERQESVAHITQAEQEAKQAFEDALSNIERWADKQQPQQTSGGKQDEPPKPTIKPRKVVEPSKLVASPYLESIEEVNSFLEKLRGQLEEAIQQGQRIQIR
ncbi:BREX system P-loop protein BrxC [Candidatus Laterigemmans baculatus]|uniref:BREX system P-loop protein BrxC n=1 Tax=Candidatus Laterigemmans baculatus TaxID=2770505 RepID=UPI0013DB1545|nr:BREX system P-loop protein BrxC [Candidatus Laterigemmans baculatus]